MKNLKWVILGTAFLVLGITAPLAANIWDPPGCLDNNLNLSLAKDKAQAAIGETVTFTVSVTNENGTGCNVSDANVELTLPALDGTPTGTVILLDSDVDFPADGSGDITYPGEAWVVDLNPGVTSMTAQATVRGLLNDSNDVNDIAEVTKTVSIGLVEVCVEVEKTVDCDISMPGETVIYEILITNCGDRDLTRVSIIDDLLGEYTADCNEIPVGQDCLIEDIYEIPLDACDPNVQNVVTVIYVDAFANEVSDYDKVDVELIYPDFEVTKSCQNEPVPPGGSAIFDITIMNTGDVDLEFSTNEPCWPGPFVIVAGGDANMTVSRAFDGNDVFNSVTVTANLADELCLDINDIVKEANDTCSGGGDATRTPGFWKTHTDYTEHVFNVHCGAEIDLGWLVVDSNEDIFGVFWAHKSRNTDGSRRDRLCRARIHASFHALAAILNSCLSNGAALPVSAGEIATILGGTDIDAIKDLASQLAAYNESGDDVTIIDDDGYMIAHADPKLAKEDANYAVADCINGAITSNSNKGGKKK
ncbi:MAG: COG1361 family protein [Planctomycetota bacterium]|jgi:uncharacterized repeat protein (TIGR01451 family)